MLGLRCTNHWPAHIVGVSFKVDIYRPEGGDGWSLEVVNGDGTSIVWDDLFDDDQAAFVEAWEHPKLCVWASAHAVETGHRLSRSG
jgi:hypothetical protein